MPTRSFREKLLLSSIAFSGHRILEMSIFAFSLAVIMQTQNYSSSTVSCILRMLFRSASSSVGEAYSPETSTIASFITLIVQLLHFLFPLMAVVLFLNPRLVYKMKERNIYCVDYGLFRPPENWKRTRDESVTIISTKGKDLRYAKPTCCTPEEAVEFHKRMLQQTGLGEKTAWPPVLKRSLIEGKTWPAHYDICVDEFRQVVFPAFRDMLNKTGIDPKNINFLITNCSIFNPCPSMCAMVIKEFELSSSISSYHLSGMGCSANGISVNLAKKLLCNAGYSSANPGNVSYCVVISTEILSPCIYRGVEKSFMLQNSLFRCGASCTLLSNGIPPINIIDSQKSLSALHRPKLKLLKSIRTQITSQEAYNVIVETTDSQGFPGIRLDKDIVQVAGKCIKKNFSILFPRLLSYTELFKCMIYGKKYTPNITKCIQHWCIHTGGRGVLDGLENDLGLSSKNILPSRRVLRDMGNTSSSSVWYEMDMVERLGGKGGEGCEYDGDGNPLETGHKILQVTFGSGFKCNSSVWEYVR